jgi:hypothetical protein
MRRIYVVLNVRSHKAPGNTLQTIVVACISARAVLVAGRQSWNASKSASQATTGAQMIGIATGVLVSPRIDFTPALRRWATEIINYYAPIKRDQAARREIRERGLGSVEWESMDTTVARVNSLGQITGIREGTVQIRVCGGGGCTTAPLRIVAPTRPK